MTDIRSLLPLLDSCSFSRLEAQANEAATGCNHLPEPTPAQTAAGNYKMGRTSVQGLPLRIENVRGSVRSGVSDDGKAWSNRMAAHYGYIAGTRGADGDAVDVFVGLFPDSPRVWVINQKGPAGGFDEHKVMLGFVNEDQAKAAYLHSYSRGWQGMQSIVPISISQLKWWLRHGNKDVPLSLDQLPHEGDITMDQVSWNQDAAPSMPMHALMYAMRRQDTDGLLLDSVTAEEIMTDPDIEERLVMDAMVVEVGMLRRKMEQLRAVMASAGLAVKPTEDFTICDPVKMRGTLQIAVVFPMDDGQAVTVWLHNPDTSPAKLTPMDELVSWKWMLNKKDVTIVVAPERGRDLNAREVGRRIMKLADKNSEPFKKANERASALAAEHAALDTEIPALEAEFKAIQHELEVARIAKADGEVQPKPQPWEAKGFVPTDPVQYAVLRAAGETALKKHQDELDAAFVSRIYAVRNALRDLGWEFLNGVIMGQKSVGGSPHSVVHENVNVGGGRNVVGVTWSVDDGTSKFEDTFEIEPQDLAQRINRSIEPAAPSVLEGNQQPAIDPSGQAAAEEVSAPVGEEVVVPVEPVAAVAEASVPPVVDAPAELGNPLSGVPGTILAELDGNEVLSRIRSIDDDGDAIPAHKQVFDAAREYFRQVLQGDTFKHPQLGAIKVNGSVSWGKVKRGLTYNMLRVKLLAAIPALLTKGFYVGTSPTDKTRADSASAFHYLLGWVSVAGVSVEVGVSLAEMDHGRFMYNLSDSPSELLAKKQSRIVKSGESPTDPALDSTAPAAEDSDSVAQDGATVNFEAALDDAGGQAGVEVMNFYVLKVVGADGQDVEDLADQEEAQTAAAPAAELTPAQKVDEAYRFDQATERFKDYIADSVNEAEFSLFATAKVLDQAAKERGGAISWDIEDVARLDSVEQLDAAAEPMSWAGFKLVNESFVRDQSALVLPSENAISGEVVIDLQDEEGALRLSGFVVGVSFTAPKVRYSVAIPIAQQVREGVQMYVVAHDLDSSYVQPKPADSEQAAAIMDAVSVERAISGLDIEMAAPMQGVLDGVSYAISALESSLSVVESNEPINRAEGKAEQADLEAKVGQGIREALAVLQKHATAHEAETALADTALDRVEPGNTRSVVGSVSKDGVKLGWTIIGGDGRATFHKDPDGRGTQSIKGAFMGQGAVDAMEGFLFAAIPVAAQPAAAKVTKKEARQAYDDLDFTVSALNGHMDDELVAQDVPARLQPKIDALQGVVERGWPADLAFSPQALIDKAQAVFERYNRLKDKADQPQPEKNPVAGDISYRSVDGLFTAFFPDSKAGEKAWTIINAQPESEGGKVLTVHAESVIEQLRAAGYTVTEAQPTNFTEEELAALEAELQPQDAPATEQAPVVEPEVAPVVETDISRLNALKKAAPKGSITSDDPLALEKLRAKLAALSAEQEFMKKANKFVKANNDAGLLAMGLSQVVIEGLKKPDFGNRIGFPDYMLTNNNGVISTTRKRIATIEAAAERERAAAEAEAAQQAQEQQLQAQAADLAEPIVAAEPDAAVEAPAVQDVKPEGYAEDRAYMQSLIDGTIELLDPGIAGRLEGIFAKHVDDAEMMGLLNKAAEAYTAAAVAAAKGV